MTIVAAGPEVSTACGSGRVSTNPPATARSTDIDSPRDLFAQLPKNVKDALWNCFSRKEARISCCTLSKITVAAILVSFTRCL